MNLAIIAKKNTIAESLRNGVRTASRPNRIWRAGITAFCSVAQRSFSDASLRISSWRAKFNKQPATLRKTGTLWRLIRPTEVTDRGAKGGSDRKYASIHQFGGTVKAKPGKMLKFPGGDKKFVRAAVNAAKKTAKATGSVRGKGNPATAGYVFVSEVWIPPRPYFPVYPRGTFSFAAKAAVESAMRAELARQLKAPGAGA